jgi:hypothetical protein
VPELHVSFFARLWLALVCLVRIVFDARFAGRVLPLVRGAPEPPRLPEPVPEAPAAFAAHDGHDPGAALGLLSLFQREGRLVDFLQQDIAAFPDADVGAAARVVHEGCRRALRAHFELEHVRDEAEGTTVTLSAGFDNSAVKLTGDVRGEPPYRGVLRHSGWRVRRATLPEQVPGHDARVVYPAEVEL